MLGYSLLNFFETYFFTVVFAGESAEIPRRLRVGQKTSPEEPEHPRRSPALQRETLEENERGNVIR